MEEKSNDWGKDKLQLTELVDVEVLQRIQDAFADMTGIAAVTADIDGVPITQGSNFSEFCEKYNRSTELGYSRCKQCDKNGAEEALRNGKPSVYICHAGLADFAAPIIANGEFVGCFVGGQVRIKETNKEELYHVAEELGVDPEAYYEAAKKVKVLPKETVDKAAKFLYSIANILSNMAYSKYLAHKAKEEIQQTANMKSDFLANMSHEIRTPMNAVIGMAEMALREELTPAARDYIQQIKASGQTLLTIINDVLDFSKIESGKMDIITDEYETMSVIHDVTSIIMTRLKDKNVELIVDVVPDIPEKLYGDVARNKQILINLANNAAKFTHQGYVALHIGYEKLGNDTIEVQVSVEDTGIGIRESELKKLFQSFQQLDSKRNRNIEGTGLGLAITKRLLDMMNGSIRVESTYNKGSTFSFSLPQKVAVAQSGICIDDAEKFHIIGVGNETIVQQQIAVDAKRLGISYEMVPAIDDVELSNTNEDENVFLFIEHSFFSPYVENFVRIHPKLTVVLIVDFFANVEYDIPNLRIMKKPIYALNLSLLLKNKELVDECSDAEVNTFDFIAPSAEILIVDDNPVNLTVAEGLLEPLQMKIETASGGLEAVDKISAHRYDLVLMDHMMPELDGVETTHIIRRFHKEYDDVPIIMLTANAVDGTKQMFLKEGMNDFVAKPIEVQVLAAAIKRWLPIDKIQKVRKVQTMPEVKAEKTVVVADLDTKTAIKRLGSEKLFWTVLRDYYKAIQKKAQVIETAVEQCDWPQYTTEVHALKSTSKQIGADQLSELAAKLERAGNARDIDIIKEETGELLEQYLKYDSILKSYFIDEVKTDKKKEKISKEFLEKCMDEMSQAIENLDMFQMENILSKIEEFQLEEEQEVYYKQLAVAIEDYDAFACENILNEWKKQ
ncbi:MAG: PocR ligand-binding domain-containing protein [Lachnospiraceae bacterium]|nr:PocR ligand-binding domain-containing protein [Lachnospiraceae bacterium]